jgi:YHS domain-containing protein
MNTAIDPVCGMEVHTGPEALTSTLRPATISMADPEGRHRGVPEADDPGLERFWFCGRGCLLDFGDEPARYLDAGYRPSGM